MSANYDNSAWFYDRLSRLVYGRALIKAQQHLLPYIPPNALVLIAGGGTGNILEYLAAVHPEGLTVYYAEVSEKMLERSRKRNAGRNKIIFINEAIEHVIIAESFDVVITPFLFDNFNASTFDQVFGYLHRHLKAGGLWLNADFQLTGKWWQGAMLKTMFLFFKMVCGIEASALPDIKHQFDDHHYSVINQQTFFGEFVWAAAYQNEMLAER
jgi:ubiquinone/menaquinone biosynthesis C-methylase UbiE